MTRSWRCAPGTVLGVGLGVHAPSPGGHDGLNALLHQPNTQDIDIPTPIRDQAGQRRVRLGSHQNYAYLANAGTAPIGSFNINGFESKFIHSACFLGCYVCNENKAYA